MTCSNRSKNQLIFLSQKQTALELAFFFSIMLQAISIMWAMLFLLERCQNAQTMGGLTGRMGRKCEMEPMVSTTLHKLSISQMTILQCLGGLREWKTSFTSGVCGQKMSSMPNAKVSSVYPAVWTVAVGICYSHSQTSLLKNPSSKNTLHHTATFATSIWSSTVNWILSNSIGALWNSIIAQARRLRIWMQWKKMCLHVLMLYHCFTFVGGCFYPIYPHVLGLFCFRFANQSGRFMSVYVQGLSGAEAVWANHRYHSHCTLPPNMVQKAKSFQKK